MAISVENYLHCCRICLALEKSDYFLDIDSTQLPEADVSIQAALRKTTGVECPADDRLPSKICQCCQLRLQDAYNFIIEFSNNSLLLESLKEKAMEIDERVNPVELPSKSDVKDEKEACHEEYLTPEGVSSSETEILQIERLEATPGRTEMVEDYVIYELNERGPGSCEVKEQDGSEINSESDSETAEEDAPADEDATDAVDFILRNLQPTSKRKRNYTHTVERRYQCEVCEKSFQRKSNLVDHLRLHANVKLFACSYCSAAFVQAGNLKSHIRKHTLEKPYSCQFCDKSYSQSSALKTHIRTHTNTRDYICNTCGKGFTNSSDLNKHKVTHSGLRFYQCVRCDNRFFTQKVHLKKHLASHHPDENFDQLLQEGTLKEGVCINSDLKRNDRSLR